MATASTLMSAEEFLALPDDPTKDRWLIRGQLREKPMTYRNRWHSTLVMSIGYFLRDWIEKQPSPKGLLCGGEAGFRLRGSQDSIVGIDVAYVSAEIAAKQPKKSTVFEGVPTLAVEVLSPSDKQEEVDEKVELYLAVGVPLVWIVRPRDRTITIYRPARSQSL